MKKKKRIIIFSVFCLLIVMAFAIFKLPKDKTFTTKVMAKIFNDPKETTYITKIEINYDPYIARLSPGYTYNEAREVFEDNVSFPEEAKYYEQNVYFWYCSTDEACPLAEVKGGYEEQIKKDRYTYVDFEIEASDCTGNDAVCDYDFYHTEEELKDVEVWVNGVKRDDAIIIDFNPYWHSVDVYIPIPTDDSSFVKKITVTSAANNIERGTSANFTANISYYGEGYNTYEWSVIGATSANTNIDSEGHLTVGADETANSIKVRASSNKDIGKYGEKEMTIIDEPLSIDYVNVTPKDKTVVYGGSDWFYAYVSGTANKDVIWSVSGANSAETTIDEDGHLTVGADETATSITVTATSAFDNTKFDSVTIITRATEYINKVEINYDTEAVVFSTRTTYDEVKEVIKRENTVPANAHYSRGNNNVWMYYCPTAERCETGLTNAYDTNMQIDKYTYVEFEIYADPYDNDTNNPLYDFDEDNLTDIEIWINGELRDDVFVQGYNEVWRAIDIYVPVTVTDGKLAQYFDFYNDNPHYINYGASPSQKDMREYARIGDGKITYKSSDETIATVDAEGNVTPVKVGTCTITATASETEEYKEFSASYTVIVSPKYVHPSISGYEYNNYYTGDPIHPEIVVTVDNGETTLVKDVDYTIEYGENTNFGMGYIYIHPIEGANYTFPDPMGVNIYVSRKTILDEHINVSKKTMYYTGEYLEPAITIEIDGRTLVKDVDYTVSYSSNINIGTAYVNVRGTGNYDGYASTTFEIVEPPEYQKGDLNKNEKIDLPDIIYLLKRYLNLEETTPEDILLGDMNENGKLDLQDVIMLLKAYLKIE